MPLESSESMAKKAKQISTGGDSKQAQTGARAFPGEVPRRRRLHAHH